MTELSRGVDLALKAFSLFSSLTNTLKTDPEIKLRDALKGLGTQFFQISLDYLSKQKDMSLEEKLETLVIALKAYEEHEQSKKEESSKD